MLNILLSTLLLSASVAGAPVEVNCPKDLGREACVYYKVGADLGREDASAKRDSDYQRHESEFEKRFEHAFRMGYKTGFDGQAKHDQGEHHE